MKKLCAHCIYEALPHTIKTIPAETILFLEGDDLDVIYRIKEGLIKINRVHQSGDEKVFDILGEGDYVALLAVLQGKTEYVASAETLTDCTLLQMTYQDVKDAYESNLLFQQSCLHCAVTRTHSFQNKLFHSTNIDTEEKILGILQLLANRYGITENGVITLTLPFNRTVLADLIGIRRETLSRKLSSMQDQGILTIDKQDFIFHRM